MLMINSSSRSILCAGTLPAVYSKLRSLNGMWLDRNKISGGIECSWIALCQLALLTDWRAASYAGSLPPEWASLSAGTLSAPHNALTGSLPDLWRKLKSLTSLHFQGNQLTGVFTPCSTMSVYSFRACRLDSVCLADLSSSSKVTNPDFKGGKNRRLALVS